MRNKILALGMLIAILASVLAVSGTAQPVQAQGDKPIVCDSTLATLVYLAIHDYGYHPSMDLTKFETGQFKPLFDAMEAAMMAATPNAMMSSTPDAMMASTPDAMMAGTQQAMMSGVELKPGVVQGENEACTKARADVEAYLYKTLTSKMMTK